MSAIPNPLPRKPASSEGIEQPKSKPGYFPFRHEWIEEIRRLTLNLTEYVIVVEVLSMANRRSRDGSVEGWAYFTSLMLAQITRTTKSGRAVTQAIKALVARGVLESMAVKDAIEQSLLFPGEAPGRFGFMLRCPISKWAKLPDADVPLEREDGPETPEREPADRVRKLGTIRAGRKKQALDLPPAQLKRIETISSSPCDVSISICGEALRIGVQNADIDRNIYAGTDRRPGTPTSDTADIRRPASDVPGVISRGSLHGGTGRPGVLRPILECGGYPLTIAEIRKENPAVDGEFCQRLFARIMQVCQNSNEFAPEKLSKITDKVIAAAVKTSYETGPPTHRTGLLLSRVPAIIITWSKEK